jgi:hypothetical protein
LGGAKPRPYFKDVLFLQKSAIRNPKSIVNLIQNGQILSDGKTRFGSETERTR